MNNTLSFSLPICIRPSETNQQGVLRSDATANYMEDIATQHATALGVGLSALQAHNISWAMSKMRISFHSRPAANTSLTLKTRPSVGQHNTYLREFFFEDTHGKRCITAITWWVAFDLTSRKMTPLPESLNTFPQDSQPELESTITIPPIKRVPQTFNGPSFTIRRADIDQNNHVNNVRYVSFVEEAGLAYNPQATLKCIELIFRAECHYGDTIATTNGLEKEISSTEYTLLHSLHTENGELLRGRSFWKKYSD